MKILTKLNSNKGASILLALMLFFVCFMVASVILSSATANIDKMQDRDTSQKEYLSVSSAAKLLRHIFGDAEYTGWETQTAYDFQDRSAYHYIDNRGRPPWVDLDISKYMDYVPREDAGMKADLERMVYTAFTSHTTYVSPKSVDAVLYKYFVISGEGMEDVNVSMALDTTTYMLTCVLTVKDSAEGNNAMTVVFKRVNLPSEIDKRSDYFDEAYKYAEYRWDESRADWGSGVEKCYKINQDKTTTTILYDAGTIKKGAQP
ncbi:hypothetical protein DSECCO2_152100 [anaerobic digester metagenome]